MDKKKGLMVGLAFMLLSFFVEILNCGTASYLHKTKMSKQKYEFKVEDMPPRNVRRKSKSMWNNPTEAHHLIKLRKEAYAVLNGSPPLSEDISLSIKIHLPQNYNKPGDLDNFITGICDGLMKCPNNPDLKLDETFKQPEHAKVLPKSFAMVEDDGKIVKITATKTVEDIEEPFYEVVIEGDP